MKISIVYQSLTGNTRQLAEAVQAVLPSEMLFYIGTPDAEALKADLIFAGSWTDKGLFSQPMLDFLAQCHNKSLALFATCGFGQAEEYYQAILQRTAAKIPADNLILASFACQGRMHESVKQRYQTMQAKEPDNPRWTSLLENYDSALSHPDNTDLHRCQQFARDVLTKIK